MIYASTNDGLLIGLSAGNLERLKNGEPILRDGMGVLPTLRIIYGETEAAIVEYLVAAGVMDAETAAAAKAAFYKSELDHCDKGH